MMHADDLVIGGQSIARGRRRLVSLPVFRDVDDSEVTVGLHVVHGAEPGPTLTLSSMLHGDEWLMLEVIRDVLAAVDPASLRGTLLAFPVGNPYAFRGLRRTSREILEFDTADLNRQFPGDETWLGRRIARTLTDEVLSKTTHLIDFHPGPVGSAWMQVLAGHGPDEAANRQTQQMALAFGVPLVHKMNMVSSGPGPSSISGYAVVKLGIPAIVPEIGGLGFGLELERGWQAQNVRGVLGVMQSLGMLDGEPAYADQYLVFERFQNVRPTTSGYLEPLIEVERLGTEVQEGESLARIISAISFEEREVLRAPMSGMLFTVARPYPVQPANYAYGIASTEGGWRGR